MKATMIRSTAMAMAFAAVTFFGQGAEAREVDPAPQAPRAECCEVGMRVAAQTFSLIHELDRADGYVSAREEIANVVGGVSGQVVRGTVVLGRGTP